MKKPSNPKVSVTRTLRSLTSAELSNVGGGYYPTVAPPSYVFYAASYSVGFINLASGGLDPIVPGSSPGRGGQ